MPAPTDTGPADRRGGVEERVLLVVFALLVWWTRFTPPEHPATPDLDPSWAQALGYALVHGLRFGHDLVFTYGPLGWFAHSAWQPELFWWKLVAFEGVFKLAIAALLAHALTRLPGTIEKLLCALLLLVPDPGLEAYYFVAVIAIAARLYETAPRGVARSIPLWSMLAVIAWIKFTYLLLGVAAAAFVVLDLARAGERKRAVVHAFGHAAVFAIALLALWIACGQRVLDLPAYLAGSWELSRGYTEAMSQEVHGLDHVLAIASLAAGAIATVLASSTLPRARVASRLLLFAAGAFVAFKAGFVSAGSTTITCFGYAFAAPWILAREVGSTRARRGASLARVAAVVLAFWGYQRAQDASDGGTGRPFSAWNDRLAANTAEIEHLPVLREAYRLEREALRAANDLPRIRERVGDAEADVIGSELGVLFLNDVAWRPRPVIQSYAAYTEALARKNAEHFASERAPRFVLLRFSTLDSRLPGLDDGPALRELLVRYRALFEEQGYLLLERRDAPRAVGPARVLVDREAGFDEEVALPATDGHGGVLSIDVRPSLSGRVRGFLASTPRVDVAVRTETGFEAVFRLVIGAARAGVLVDPWLLGQETWDDAFTGVAKDRVVAVRVTCADSDRGAFEPEVRVRYEARPGLLPPVDRELAKALESSMFDRPPVSKRETIPFTRTAIEGRSALLVHAPSELAFEPGAGRWRVEAGFGMLAGSWDPPCTDGAVFVLAIRTPRGDGGLWRRKLEPGRVESDRGTQRVAQEIELAAGAQILLRTNVGTAGNGACDWCYWTDVRFVRVGDGAASDGAGAPR